MTKSYTFKTIVAPEQVRADFTVLRDSLNSSDKELMQAFWNVAMANMDSVTAEVAKLREQTAVARQEKKELKMAAKKAEKAPKAPKKKAEKAPKKKADKPSKQAKEVVATVANEDDFEVLVVDGTK
jgi:hypothetical protein